MGIQQSKYPDESKKKNSFEFNKNDIKMLGIYWNSDKDYFAFKMQIREIKATKRSILSEVASIYVPVGWLSPVTFKAFRACGSRNWIGMTKYQTNTT